MTEKNRGKISIKDPISRTRDLKHLFSLSLRRQFYATADTETRAISGKTEPRSFSERKGEERKGKDSKGKEKKGQERKRNHFVASVSGLSVAYCLVKSHLASTKV